ncbi:MAG TPA: ROK family protein [Stellaceae bacterium]|jgi:predicted TIM-barrel fold metal-dependent hydrolase|nr:ROK family protein [Stellaceae bacterium]
MSDRRTLAVDIGGTGIKFAALDDNGRIVGDPARVPTPPKPVAPEQVVAIVEETSAKLGDFARVSVGFPGMVRGGKVLTAPNLGTELWAGFDLQSELAKRLGKPVRVMNDADVQGYGAIEGKGVEMVLTLGTGAGTSLFENGHILPHLELAHHPLHGNKTYDEYLGNAAFTEKGKKRWSKRVARTIEVLRTVVNFDHLYLGGGNAKKLTFELPPDITVVPNTDGLTGGIRLWHDEDMPAAPTPAAPPASAKASAKPAAKSAAKLRTRSTTAAKTTRTLVPSQPKTAVGFRMPPGACDCHVHVFGSAEAFPFVTSRGYTPPPAGADDLLKLQSALGLSRVVIVQPSVYGTDNSCTLDGMRRLGPERARGVAVIDDHTTDAALKEMHEAGIRGVRVNLETGGVSDPAISRRNLADAIKRVAPLGWHVQVYTRLSVVEAVHDDVMKSGVPVVFDHFGGAQAADGIDQPGFAVLLDLVRSGKAYVKVSGHYRSSTKAPAFDDVAPLARALIAANPDRIVWGTDWPHPHHADPGTELSELTPSFDIDDGLALAQLPRWAPTAATRRKILVDNPARLYDF